jgi:hypothetical protein
MRRAWAVVGLGAACLMAGVWDGMLARRVPRPAAALAADSALEADPLLPPFGLDHVDLMDLHAARLPDGGVEDREVLPRSDLESRYRAAKAAGAGWNRWSLYWDLVERGANGQFNWTVADGIVRRDMAAGLRTLAILQGTPPRYASSGRPDVQPPAVGGWPARIRQGTTPRAAGAWSVQAAVPKGLSEPIFRQADGSPTDDPARAAAINADNPWARYVAAAVERYRPGGELATAESWPAGAGVRYLADHLDPPLLSSATDTEAAAKARANLHVIERLLQEFDAEPRDILFGNDVTLYLQAGTADGLIARLARAGTVVANGYRGERLGAGELTRRERAETDRLAAWFATVGEVVELPARRVD